MSTQEKLEELKSKGISVYSISKLNTFHNCHYEYYKSYILKEEGIPNVYTLLGSEIHNGVEGVYLGEFDKEAFRENYENKLMELEMLGIDFPNEYIKKNWIADVNHFVDNFQKKDTKIAIETHLLFQLDGIWLQGYVDAIVPSEKGHPYVNVIDWKTSSKFSGKKLLEAGRQLVMYKLGIENSSDYKVDKVMWNMIKYVNVCWNLKNGKVKKKMCNRGKWVKEMRSVFEREMKKLDLPEFEVEMLLEKAVIDNNIDYLPKEIREKYWIEDCMIEYEITDETIDEFKQYVKNTVQEIESKTDSPEDWPAVEINDKTSFYCGVLCSHRKKCPIYKEFLENNMAEFEEKDDKNDKMSFENLFG